MWKLVALKVKVLTIQTVVNTTVHALIAMCYWNGQNTVCPEGVRPYGVRPGVRPYGVRPEGVCPYGVRPEGVHPYGVRPEGVCPYGVHPEGVCPYSVRMVCVCCMNGWV